MKKVNIYFLGRLRELCFEVLGWPHRVALFSCCCWALFALMLQVDDQEMKVFQREETEQQYQVRRAAGWRGTRHLCNQQPTGSGHHWHFGRVCGVQEESIVAFFCGEEVKLWDISITTGGTEWENAWGRTWMTILEEEVLTGCRETESGKVGIDIFAHSIICWEWEGQLVLRCGYV